jgi:thiamine biosynthesis lipoprotein
MSSIPLADLPMPLSSGGTRPMNFRIPSMIMRLVLLLLALMAAHSLAFAAGKPARGNRAAVVTGPNLERSMPVMDEVLGIIAASRGNVTDTVRASAALDLAFAEAERLAGVFAPGDGTSELARLNRSAAEQRFSCSADLYAALEAAAALAGETDGAYDPTSGPLLRAWERRSGARAPDTGNLAAARRLTGWRMFTLDPGNRTARFARPGMEVALGAIARGVVLERTAGVLRERGIARARLELGGDVLAFTTHDAWSAAIPSPAGDGATVMTLMVSNGAVATARSGRNGNARVLDPRTGQLPLGEASVTVVERSVLRVRALAEALLVQGRDDAEAYASAHPETGVLWLEPLGGGLRAWVWNLGRVATEPGVRVEWMTEP